MTAPASGLVRWLKFNAVGAVGVAVQLIALTVLKSGLGVNYLIATAVAVEATVLHNFFWHERFTWADRKTTARLQRLAQFNLTNGAISISGNLTVMKLLAGGLGLNYFLSNILSITICSLLNFLISDRFVFAQPAGESPDSAKFPQWENLSQGHFPWPQVSRGRTSQPGTHPLQPPSGSATSSCGPQPRSRQVGKCTR